MKKFLALLHARNLEFYRDRASLSWNLLFPVLIVVGFVFAFSDDDRFLYKVGVYGTDTAWQQTPWGQIEHIEWVPVDELEHGIEAVRYHQLDLFVATDAPGRYWVNEDSAKGYILEELFTGRTDNQLHREPVTGRKVRYLDWVLPGILGMNMMFGSLFGVGYVIVRYRKNGVLKRLQATPVTPLELHRDRRFGAEVANELGLEIRPVVVPLRRVQTVLALIFGQCCGKHSQSGRVRPALGHADEHRHHQRTELLA